MLLAFSERRLVGTWDALNSARACVRADSGRTGRDGPAGAAHDRRQESSFGEGTRTLPDARHYLAVDTDGIAGSFVVEIGFRQAWPFLGFCDNRPTPAREVRLYIDAIWTIGAADPMTGSADDDVAWFDAAIALNGQTVDEVRVVDDGALRLRLDSGMGLVISGEPQPNTVGEPWWLTDWRPI